MPPQRLQTDYNPQKCAQTSDGSPPLVAFVPSPNKTRNNERRSASPDYRLSYPSITPPDLFEECPPVHCSFGRLEPRNLSEKRPTTLRRLDLSDNQDLEPDFEEASVPEVLSSEPSNLQPTTAARPSSNPLLITDSEDSQLGLSFSQEYAVSSCESEEDDISSEGSQLMVADEELMDLQGIQKQTESLTAGLAQPSNSDRRVETVSDFLSSLFHNPLDDKEYGGPSSESEDDTIPTEDELHSRLSGQQPRKLPDWNYSSPFEPFTIEVDDTDERLLNSFLLETNSILMRVVDEVKATSTSTGRITTASDLSYMDVFDALLPETIMQNIRSCVNKVLQARNKPAVDVEELKGVIILHVLAASYNNPVSTITSEKNKEFFFQLGIGGQRYLDVWSAFSCSTEKRQRVEHHAYGWSNRPIEGNALITDLENSLAAVNRTLLYVPGATIFSLDDDHQRLRSRAVTEFTNLSQVNNPKKALGPVNNAMCSALTSVFLASHYSRPKEQVIHIWQGLVQLIQGVPTVGAIQPMVDAVFAADRGYNSKETIDFINEKLGATGLGTHKRSLDYPFVFGDGPITKRHKGMRVSERGCRAIYSATRRPQSCSGRAIEASVYRESYSGRIAAIYHNDKARFCSTRFTLIPKEAYRYSNLNEKLEDMQVVFDRSKLLDEYRVSMRAQATVVTRNAAPTISRPRMKVDSMLSNVNHLTLMQAEDPGWFLARAFTFTSRTTYSFIKSIASHAGDSFSALATVLSGKKLYQFAEPLSSDLEELTAQIDQRWVSLSEVLGTLIQRNKKVDNVDVAVSTIRASSQMSLLSMRKEQLQSLLSAVGHRMGSAVRKQQLVDKILQLKSDEIAGRIVIQPASATGLSEEQLSVRRIDCLKQILYETSLSSWVMKPLFCSAGMREGSMNEIQVLKALQNFVSLHTAIDGDTFESGCMDSCSSYSVEYVRSVGLISSRTVQFLADSPDAVVGMKRDSEEIITGAVEVKTMTSVSTIKNAHALRERFSAFVRLQNVGRSSSSTHQFKSLVPTPEYRAQCLHHCVTIGTPNVLFVVAKGSSHGLGEIIYAVLVQFSQCIRTAYLYSIESIRTAAFDWLGDGAKYIPEKYDDLLQGTFATDLTSFASYYNLSLAYKSLVTLKGPQPPARMIRPTALIHWNVVKGGVDEFSRALKTLAYTNNSENPIVSVIGRLLCSQVHNMAVVIRLSIAKRKGYLDNDSNTSRAAQRLGYSYVRHHVTRCLTFSEFARRLAFEYKQRRQYLKTVQRAPPLIENVNMKPMYPRDAVSYYNRDIDRQRRLSGGVGHRKVKHKPTYCSLCSFNHNVVVDGVVYRKKGGARERLWCSTCRQPICSKCWDKWHTEETLTRATISKEDLERMKRKIESGLDSS